MLLGLVSGMCIGGTAGYLGSLMLGRRMALVAGPLGHLSLPGVALALVCGFDISLGAFPFVVLGVVAIWLLERRTRLPMEALTALVFASGVGIAFLALPIERAEVALLGDITAIGAREAAISVVTCVVVVMAIRHVYAGLILINVSEDLATSEGVRVGRYNFYYLLLISVVVALGVRMVGGLLTAALVAIPPSTARRASRTLRQYALGSLVVGATSAAIGIGLHRFTGAPAGPLVILASTAIFLGTLPLRPR